MRHSLLSLKSIVIEERLTIDDTSTVPVVSFDGPMYHRTNNDEVVI
jgi:hypothetical protein